jgi:hypothetical protein
MIHLIILISQTIFKLMKILEKIKKNIKEIR